MIDPALRDLIQQTIQQQMQLPTWAVWAGIIGGVITAIVGSITLIKLLVDFLRRPKLELKLTSEVFLRLTQEGEGIFCNSVMLAHDGSVEIRNVSFKLIKHSDHVKKEFNVKAKRFGEKVKQDNEVEAQHYFPTTSPISYVTEGTVVRQLYLAAIDEYDQDIKLAIEKFNNDIYELVKPASEKLQAGQKLDPAEVQSIVDTGKTLREGAMQAIKEKLQIEDGKYILQITVAYKPVDKFYRFGKSINAQSQIEFSVVGYIQTYDGMLERLFTQITSNYAQLGTNPQQGTLYWPEYVPIDSKEID